MNNCRSFPPHPKLSVILLTLVLAYFPSKAQKTFRERDDQQWIQYVNLTSIAQKWVIHSSTSFRWRDTYHRGTQFHIRSGVGYQFTDQVRFLSGIGFFRPINNSSVIHHELRPFQELRIGQDVGKTRIVNRFQVEERFLNRVETGQTDPVYMRFRYALNFTFPVADFSGAGKSNELQITLRNELFINGQNSSQEKTFDQDRITLGPILAMEQFSFLLLWHNQISSLSYQGGYRYTSILAFQVSQRLNL